MWGGLREGSWVTYGIKYLGVQVWCGCSTSVCSWLWWGFEGWHPIDVLSQKSGKQSEGIINSHEFKRESEVKRQWGRNWQCYQRLRVWNWPMGSAEKPTGLINFLLLFILEILKSCEVQGRGLWSSGKIQWLCCFSQFIYIRAVPIKDSTSPSSQACVLFLEFLFCLVVLFLVVVVVCSFPSKATHQIGEETQMFKEMKHAFHNFFAPPTP